MDMSNSEIAKFIILVKNEPSIWNQMTKEYRIPNIKDIAWRRVAKRLNITVYKGKLLLKSLREKYRREKLKETEDPLKGGAITWEHYNSLKFLDLVFRQRKFYPNITAPPELENKSKGNSRIDYKPKLICNGVIRRSNQSHSNLYTMENGDGMNDLNYENSITDEILENRISEDIQENTEVSVKIEPNTDENMIDEETPQHTINYPSNINLQDSITRLRDDTGGKERYRTFTDFVKSSMEHVSTDIAMKMEKEILEIILKYKYSS